MLLLITNSGKKKLVLFRKIEWPFEDTVTKLGRQRQDSLESIYALNQHLLNGTVYPIARFHKSRN